MRLPFKKFLGLGITTAILVFVGFQIFSIYRSANQTLAETRARLKEQNRVTFEKKNLAPHSSRFVQILQNTNMVRDFVKFKDSYFAATSGGLAQFDKEGKILKHFTVLDGLPESDLTCLAVFQNKLFIGTQTKNLLVFDGEKFENYVWTNRKAQAVTAFLEKDGKLLTGTRNGGLLEFDGAEFTEIKIENKSIAAVNCLLKAGAKLFVGTFDNGLWINENDTWTHFTIADGLPSNRVVGIAIKDGKLFAATDFGLAVLEEKIFRSVAELPSLSGLLAFRNQFFLVKDNGVIFTFDDFVKEFSTGKHLQNARLVLTDEKLWLASNQGIAEIKEAKIKAFGGAESEILTDNFVSALAFDRKENLWVGTFRHGVDVFAREGKKLAHLETENLREINYLAANGKLISAATSGGLSNLKADFSVENLNKKDGLPSDSVTHFAGAFVATAKGLAFQENGKLRVLSTVQGLPNNSVYTTLQTGKTLYAGTLGGLAAIENGRVVRIFKDSNSNLTTNWVTALCSTSERLFIGTYGGGIFELLPSGEIRSFEGETGKFVVNPNAIFSDGERLYAGTLAGVKILDLRTQEWKTLRKPLPAETVFSVAGSAENVYFGTTSGIARIDRNYFVKEETE